MIVRPGFAIGVLVVVTVALSALDRSLQRLQSFDLERSARDYYASGVQLLAEGRPREAVEPLRSAHSMVRDNGQYELELIVALMDSGNTAEASSLMDEILQREPNDGRANLTAARLMLRKGQTAAAEAHFHRAIYGEWRDNARESRTAARMELIELLLAKGQKQELLAETISLDAETGGRPGIQEKLASLFRMAGAPSRAAEVYQEMIARNPQDSAAYAGLGEAELEQGNYRASHAAFTRAFFLNPNGITVRARLQLLNTVEALDPTPRRLSSREKYRRSQKVLEMARASLAACAARNAAVSAPAALASPKMPAHVTNEAAEGVLAEAERVWQTRVAGCRDAPGSEEPLRLIMGRLAG